MRSVRIREFGPPGSHRVEDGPEPVPAAGEVLVDVAAATVNFPDLLVVTGRYQVLPERPFSPGKDATGTVLAVGAGVTGLGPGDRVLALVEHGAYATRLVAPASQCHRLPDGLSFVDGAAMGLVSQTAWFALVDRGAYRKGEIVFVTGAGGGVGLAAVEIARALGATVLAGVRRPAHAEAARQAGADHVIDLSVPDLRHAVREQVHDATNGHGADVVIDTLGGDPFDGALRALAWCGRMVVVGFAAGRIPEVRANYLLVKNITATGLQWSDYRDRAPDRVAEAQQHLFALHASGAIRPHVMRTFPLDQFAEAMALLQAGEVTGKVVLTMS